MPFYGARDGLVSVRMAVAPGSYVKANDLGTVYAANTGFLIGVDPDHVRAPNAAFVRRERMAAAGRVEGYWPGAPDLAVEVISPNDRYTEVAEKAADWLAAGVQLLALVNPRNRTVTRRSPGQSPVLLTEEDILDGGDLVPGWQRAVRAIFA